MVKSAQHNRITKNVGYMEMEQTIISDDQILPSPNELVAYKQAHERTVDWLLDETTNELKRKHEREMSRLEMLNKSINNERILIIALSFLLLVFILISATLIYLDKPLGGSVFAVFGLIAMWVLYKNSFKV